MNALRLLEMRPRVAPVLDEPRERHESGRTERERAERFRNARLVPQAMQRAKHFELDVWTRFELALQLAHDATFEHEATVRVIAVENPRLPFHAECELEKSRRRLCLVFQENV